MVIRGLTPDDLPQVTELLATREGIGVENAAKRAEILAYIAFKNPYAAEGEERYYVVEEDGKIVALHGRMPVLFSCGGTHVRGYYVHDLSVHRGSLKRGQGLALTLALARAVEERTDSFFCLLGMTPLNQMMQRRRRYHEMFADSYVKVIRPEEVLSIFIRSRFLAGLLGIPLRPLVWIVDWCLQWRFRRFAPLTQVSTFDCRFDRLFERIAGKFPACSVKNSIYLQWKYGNAPFNKDTAFARFTNDELQGFVVVGTVKAKGVRTGVIKEILADPDDEETIALLCLSAVRFLRKQNVSAILCLLSDERFGRIARKFLFVRRVGHEPVFVGNLEKAGVHKDVLADIRNWHMTFGDSDLFMFGRDRSSVTGSDVRRGEGQDRVTTAL